MGIFFLLNGWASNTSITVIEATLPRLRFQNGFTIFTFKKNWHAFVGMVRSFLYPHLGHVMVDCNIILLMDDYFLFVRNVVFIYIKIKIAFLIEVLH